MGRTEMVTEFPQRWLMKFGRMFTVEPYPGELSQMARLDEYDLTHVPRPSRLAIPNEELPVPEGLSTARLGPTARPCGAPGASDR